MSARAYTECERTETIHTAMAQLVSASWYRSHKCKKGLASLYSQPFMVGDSGLAPFRASEWRRCCGRFLCLTMR